MIHLEKVCQQSAPTAQAEIKFNKAIIDNRLDDNNDWH